jgi:polysaccharide pyruvyl transferase WcaK-like protein
MRIIVIDNCPESNRGDAAMQVGLLKLLRQQAPEAQIEMVALMGANQTDSFLAEYDHTSRLIGVVHGGLKPTFFPTGKYHNLYGALYEVFNAVGLAARIGLLAAIKMKIPTGIIASLLPLKYRRSFLLLAGADLIIWRGRNLRSRNQKAMELYRTLQWLYHPVICLALGKPIALVSGSFWHLNGKIARGLVSRVLNRCLYISCREEESARVARSMCSSDAGVIIEQQPDLSFALYQGSQSVVKVLPQEVDSAFPKRIALTLMDWRGTGAEARLSYIESIRGLIDHCGMVGTRVVIVPQVVKKWENTASLIAAVFPGPSKLEHVEILEGNPGIDELLRIYAGVDLLVATRMHSVILAGFVRRPAVVISYDTGPKWGILSRLGYEPYMINYSLTSAETLIRTVQKCWDDREVLCRILTDNIRAESKQVSLNISRPLALFQQDKAVTAANRQ